MTPTKRPPVSTSGLFFPSKISNVGTQSHHVPRYQDLLLLLQQFNMLLVPSFITTLHFVLIFV